MTRPLKVGVQLPEVERVVRWPELRAMIETAEGIGLDSVWVGDHLLYRERESEPVGPWEAWSQLAAIAAITTRIQLGPLVAATSFHNPGMLAAKAAAVHEFSGGRLILGLGAGWNEDEYRAFGFPFDHRVDRFAESIEITTTLLREGRATVAGRYYHVQDCPLLPARADGGRVPILVGCGGGERMMSLVARWADAWNGAWYGSPGPKFHALRDSLHAACEAAGRDPATVELTIGMIIGDKESRVPPHADAIAEALGQWRDEGVAHVIGLPDPTDAEGVAALVEGTRRFRA
jgi:alkanesulfonate monooxygenase SsuD/methylene tetrahydromethanopterin reductase-like flavin-dependent oxidoreductase (luciferase family)